MRTFAFLRLAAAATGIAAVPLLARAVLTGLARLGVVVPAFALTRAARHSVLMIPVFFGTVISLEREVAMQRTAPYTGVACDRCRRQRTLFLFVLAGAAVCWAVGDGVWLTVGDLSAAIPWWLPFLILTIAGERLELTRLLSVSRWGPRQFVLIVVVILAGATGALWWPDGSLRVFAGGLLALAAWLARHDIASHTVRQRGLVRFIAVCLFSGYGWLTVGALWASEVPSRPGMRRCTRSRWALCSRCSLATRRSSCRPWCACA